MGWLVAEDILLFWQRLILYSARTEITFSQTEKRKKKKRQRTFFRKIFLLQSLSFTLTLNLQKVLCLFPKGFHFERVLVVDFCKVIFGPLLKVIQWTFSFSKKPRFFKFLSFLWILYAVLHAPFSCESKGVW